MNTMQDYHDLYLKADVLLSVDVSEQFRKIYMQNYKSDPMYVILKMLR